MGSDGVQGSNPDLIESSKEAPPSFSPDTAPVENSVEHTVRHEDADLVNRVERVTGDAQTYSIA